MAKNLLKQSFKCPLEQAREISLGFILFNISSQATMKALAGRMLDIHAIDNSHPAVVTFLYQPKVSSFLKSFSIRLEMN